MSTEAKLRTATGGLYWNDEEIPPVSYFCVHKTASEAAAKRPARHCWERGLIYSETFRYRLGQGSWDRETIIKVQRVAVRIIAALCTAPFPPESLLPLSPEPRS